MPLNNPPFKVTDNPDKFAINGQGYAMIFRILKFAGFGILFTLLPLAILLMIIYSSGNDCGDSKLANTRGAFSSFGNKHGSSITYKPTPFDHLKNPNIHKDHFSSKFGKNGNHKASGAKTYKGYYHLTGMSSGSVSWLYQNFIKRYLIEVCDVRDKKKILRDEIEFLNGAGAKRAKDVIDTLNEYKKNKELKEDYKQVCVVYYKDSGLLELQNSVRRLRAEKGVDFRTMQIIENLENEILWYKANQRLRSQGYDAVLKPLGKSMKTLKTDAKTANPNKPDASDPKKQPKGDKKGENKAHKAKNKKSIISLEDLEKDTGGKKDNMRLVYIKFYETHNVFNRCSKNLFNLISLSNRYEDRDRDEFFDRLIPYMHSVIIVTMILGVLYMLYWHEKFVRRYNSEKITIGDFTLMLTQLPFGDDFYKKNLKNEIYKIFNDGTYRNAVADVSFAFDFDEYLQKKNLYAYYAKKNYKKKLKKLLNENPTNIQNSQYSGGSLQRLPSNKLFEDQRLLEDDPEANMILVDSELKNLEKKYGEEDTRSMIGIAFVSFNRFDYRNHFLRKYGKKKFCCGLLKFTSYEREKLYMKVDGEEFRVKVGPASEPNEFIWENLKITKRQRFLRRVATDLICLLVVTCGFIWIYYLKTHKVSSFLAKF